MKEEIDDSQTLQRGSHQGQIQDIYVRGMLCSGLVDR